MTLAWDPIGVVGVASGLAMAALGLVVGSLRPLRAPSAAFAAFALCWGGSVAAANLSNMARDLPTVLLWERVNFLFLLPLFLPLAFFVASVGREKPRRMGALWAAAGAAVLLVAAYLAAPTLFVRGHAEVAGGFFPPIAGPLYAPAITGNAVLLFAVALAVLARRLFAATSASARSQLALLVASFLLYVSYRAADQRSSALVDFSGHLARNGLVTTLLVAGMNLAALGVVLWTAAGVLRRRELPWRELILACAVVPAVAGLATTLGLFAFPTVSVWRVGMVALFAYAIVRYRLFDVEVRLAAAAPLVAYLVVAGSAVAAFWAVAGPMLAANPLLATGATAGIAMVAAPAARLGRLVVERAAPQVKDPDYLYKRKVDVYRAALEESHARGMGEQTEQVFLSELRRGLGITEQEHRILLLVVQSQEKYGSSRIAPAAASAQKFRIERELGRGSFGRALLARDTVLDRHVVLKQPVVPWLLDDEGRRHFLQEARLAARVRHPNVVSVHDVLPDAEPPLIVLEYVEGGNLQEVLDRRGSLPAQEALDIALGILAGLEAIHEAGIVHRDLKPANVLLDRHGRAKVTDFGIARAPAEFAAVATLATSGAQPGSLAYMSPEQARGDDVDARTDLYAVGAILYRALAGGHYVDLAGVTPTRLQRLIEEAPPRLPAPGVPPEVEPILRRALAKRREDRYASAREMHDALLAREALPARA